MTPQTIARELVKRFDAHMFDHAKEIQELVAAGVAQHTIDALYPSELEDCAPFVEARLKEQGGMEVLAPILGSHDLHQGFRALPADAAGRADAIEYSNSFFGYDDPLLRASLNYAAETGINGNAAYCKKQWGCLLIFLREVAECPSPLGHKCSESCLLWGAIDQHTEQDNTGIYFNKWFEEYCQVAEAVLAILDGQNPAASKPAARVSAISS